MKYKHIPVEIYGWNVYFFDMGKIERKDPLLKKLSKLIGEENIGTVKTIAYSETHDGGDHFFQSKYKESVVIVYKTTSRKQKINIVLHELQHSVDRICLNTSIDDLEARAYLMGYIGSQIIPNI